MDIDSYSQQFAPGHIFFVELRASTRGRPVSPSFIFGGLSEDVCQQMFAWQTTKPVGYYVLRGAHVTHDGIALHNGILLTSPITNHPAAHCLELLKVYAPNPSNLELRRVDERCVLLFGPGWNIWGHWLADFLPRLYIMQCAGWDPNSVKWIIPAQTPAFARDLLHLAGVLPASLMEFDPTQHILAPEELIMPGNLTAGAIMHPIYAEALAWIKSRMQSKIPLPHDSPTRLYISRASNPQWRVLLNRGEVESIAEEFGYSVIEPTTLSVVDQISLFRGARLIAGEYGSGLHTGVFSPSGLGVTCLRGREQSAGMLQNALAKSCGHNLGYVFGTSLPGNAYEAFTLPSSLVKLAFECAEMGRTDMPL